MRRIPLGTGRKVALVDEKDFKKVSRYLWHESICKAAQRRPRKNGRREMVFMHQLILNIEGMKKRVIHLNGNRLDNRRANLKIMGED